MQSGADSVIIDLEDAVAEAVKPHAREHAVEWLRSNPGTRAWVRVNNRPDLFSVDLDAISPVSSLGVVIPKADLAACERTSLPVVALIETSVGVVQAREIAALPNVVRLALGEADLAADLGIEPSIDQREFAAIRSEIVVASAAAKIAAPAGPVFTDLEDADGLTTSSDQLRRQGFGGRSILHPKQIEAVHHAFTPPRERVVWARRVLDAFRSAESEGRGGVIVDGEFVDAAVARRAEAVLAAGHDQE
jgi:citrate lyase subunit beta/citryl-CoA lyase